jgi:hypothetical protein
LGFSPQISNFPSQQGSPPSRIYCQKSNLCIFNLIDQFSNHFLSASASCYFSNLIWLYIFIYILWGPKNGLQQLLQLYRLPELKCIWKGHTRNISFQSLAHLNLNYLDKLTFIFTPSLAYSLPKLESLRISDCGELKHIIREEDGEREIIPESPCFPELKNINISFCDKLEYVFPVSLSHNRDGIIKFPQLRELSLWLRSNYSFLGPRNFDAQLPLQELTIQGHEEVGNWLAQLQVRNLYFST